MVNPRDIAGNAEEEEGFPRLHPAYRLVRLVVRGPPRERQTWVRFTLFALDLFPWSSHTSDLKTGTPEDTLSGAWRYKVSAGTGWSVVSIMWLDEFYLQLLDEFYLQLLSQCGSTYTPSYRHRLSDPDHLCCVSRDAGKNIPKGCVVIFALCA